MENSKKYLIKKNQNNVIEEIMLGGEICSHLEDQGYEVIEIDSNTIPKIGDVVE